MLYAYVKSQQPTAAATGIAIKTRRSRRLSNVLSLFSLLVGLFLIGQVVYPIASWYVTFIPMYSQSIASPLSSSYAPTPNIFSAPVKAQETVSLGADSAVYDSFRPSTWFPAAPTVSAKNSELKNYTISIPKLKIDAATVEIGGEDLKKSLVAWPTSALPGNFGVNIIFGHSELPQFASPNNYSGIFTFLMDLKEGDDIFVDYDGIRYRYSVIDKKIIDPTDLSILEQRFDAAYLVVITCEPPGTLWKRGVVRARLAQI